jgi:hypothetical protein
MNQPFSLVIAPLPDIDERGTAQPSLKPGLLTNPSTFQMTGLQHEGPQILRRKSQRPRVWWVAVGPAGFKRQNCYFTKTRAQPERLSLMI